MKNLETYQTAWLILGIIILFCSLGAITADSTSVKLLCIVIDLAVIHPFVMANHSMKLHSRNTELERKVKYLQGKVRKA